MKIGIPVASASEMNSQVYGHFGSAPYFIIYDTETFDLLTINNSDKVHEHGQCNPLASFIENPIDVLITGGIGRGALMKLNMAGIKAFRVEENMTVQKLVEKFTENKLDEITPESSCSHSHGCH